MLNENDKIKYLNAQHRVNRQKGFYNHLMIYVLVNISITTVKVFGQFDSWTTFVKQISTINVYSVWLVWGAILVFHYFMYRYGTTWELKKIDYYMNTYLQTKTTRHGKL